MNSTQHHGPYQASSGQQANMNPSHHSGSYLTRGSQLVTMNPAYHNNSYLAHGSQLITMNPPYHNVSYLAHGSHQATMNNGYSALGQWLQDQRPVNTAERQYLTAPGRLRAQPSNTEAPWSPFQPHNMTFQLPANIGATMVPEVIDLTEDEEPESHPPAPDQASDTASVATPA